MSDTNKKILEMISKNASVNEICSATGLSNKQLFYRLNMLKIKGFDFSKKYYYDGEICYKLNKKFNMEEEVSLITKPSDKEFKAVFITDLHLANVGERIDLLNKIYDFCAKEEINIIINCGDLIDGLIGNKKYKKIKNIEDQIEYALKNYPFDKNILNFICLGNHDYNALESSGQNLEIALLNRRHDIVPLGYGNGTLNIKNDSILVLHPSTFSKNELKNISAGLIIRGHSHNSQNIIHGNVVDIHLAPLSNMHINKYSTLPGFIKATISFNRGIFNIGTFEQFVFLDKLYKVNESSYELFKGKNNNQEIIKNEEDREQYTKEKVKMMSQLEKFNMRDAKKR